MRDEYHTRFRPVAEVLRQQGKGPAEAEAYTREIERVFGELKMERELAAAG